MKRRSVALVCVLVVAAACGRTDTSTFAGALPQCGPNQKVIQIHGTRSAGDFKPDQPYVNQYYPVMPPPSVLGSGRNDELTKYVLRGLEQCLLTFSYDDIYLRLGAARTPGQNAWNWTTSPWDRSPDLLADNLQKLMDAYQGFTFDIVAYSAGGIVPTYWAARPQTTDEQLRRVRWIIVIDGIVSGADVGALDVACDYPLPAIRTMRIGDLGRIPCQFRYNGPFTKVVRGASWTRPLLATVRADGDLIVQHRFAGLPGKAAMDPELFANQCSLVQWFDGLGALKCVLDVSHGSVLELAGTRTAIAQAFGPQ